MKVQQLTLGNSHSCALLEDGTVRCWGANNRQQLGSPTASDPTLVPTQVSALPQAVAVQAGSDHTCALTASQEVFCWGDDQWGQLGRGALLGASGTPEPVTSLTEVTYLAPASGTAQCAVAAGELRCWGQNTHGGLGSSAIGDEVPTPVTVANVPAGLIDEVAAGCTHTCLRQGSAVHCWGSNEFGQVGIGSVASIVVDPSPVSFPNGAIPVGISTGCNTTCALVDGGAVYCWGLNTDSFLALPVTTSSLLAPEFAAQGLASVVAVHAKALINCARTTGQVRCWGRSRAGGAGNGVLADTVVSTAVAVIDENGSPFQTAHVATGWDHACALLADGTALCWGYNASGQLGDGTVVPRAVAAPVHW